MLAAIVDLTFHPPPPSSLSPDVPPELGEICLEALARDVRSRLTSALLARRLREFLDGRVAASGPAPVVPLESIRIDFIPYGQGAPEQVEDALYLDVGGALRPGVIDHHHLHHYPGSAASMLGYRLELVDAVVRRDRRPIDPFTLFLHEEPDFDALLSAYLARRYLAERRLPPVAVLGGYADRIDAGHPGFTPQHRYTPYTAFMALLTRDGPLKNLSEPQRQERWRRAVTLGFAMLDRVFEQNPARLDALLALDAFAAPVLTHQDRETIDADHDRYCRKLDDPRCNAQRATLRLPLQVGAGRKEVPALLVRHVQDEHDPQRCLFFKDWARTDHLRAGRPPGFVALAVFMDLNRLWKAGEKTGMLGRTFLSVTHGSGVSLRGLG
jgi:hypothetical protein